MPSKSSKITTARSPEREGVQKAQLKLPLQGRMESVAVGQDFVLMEITGGATLVDKDMFETLSKYKWHIGSGGYARHMNANRRATLMHRLIMGDIKGVEYDHKNGIKLDNRRVNLRAASRAQNNHNSKKRRHYGGRPSSSKYKGVSRQPEKNRWRAYITIEKARQHWLGRYATEELAAKAYNKAALIHFGEFARLNVIE